MKTAKGFATFNPSTAQVHPIKITTTPARARQISKSMVNLTNSGLSVLDLNLKNLRVKSFTYQKKFDL